MEQIRNNPLKQYFRQFKLYLKLPSGTSYYNPGVIEFTDNGEVGIMPMTGKDELLLKNPDALLNGEALVEIINSCVPAVKKPKELLTNDIDAMITAIRSVTFNDGLEMEMKCTKCSHVNSFKLNLQYALNNMTYLDPDYVVNLESGLSVFIKPYSFTDLVSGLRAQFEQSKISNSLADESISDEERLKLFSTSFKELSTITYNLICNSVIKVVDESNNVNVSDREFIKDFLHNIDKKSVDLISDQVKAINLIGIKREFTATCEQCSHEWESEIDFNPVNFS